MKKTIYIIVILLLILLTPLLVYKVYSVKDQKSQNVNSEVVNTATFENDGIPNDLKIFTLQYAIKNIEFFPYSDVDCELDDFENIPFDFKIEQVDLNDDRELEYVIYPWEICDLMMRTATGNGDIFVAMKIYGDWEIIGHLYGTVYSISENYTDGFLDISTMEAVEWNTKSFNYYKWKPNDNDALSGYQLYLTEDVKMDEEGKIEVLQNSINPKN